MNNSITFEEEVGGWTSFHSFQPDFMQGINNRFYTFKDGELYEHHQEDVPRNTYYGVQEPSKVSIMINDSPSEVKELQAVSLEGNNTWEILIRAFVSNSDDFLESSIKRVEFMKKEGIWYAYARRNESDESFDSKSTYGIGAATAIDGNSISFIGDSNSLCIGDTLINGVDLSVLGVIENIADGEISLNIPVAGLNSGDFLVGKKDSRIEGGNLRGYTIRMDLENIEDDKVELFAVNAEVMKSYS